MKKNDFELIIASPYNREKLTCELYYKNEIFGEISQDKNEFEIELYPSNSLEFWTFNLEELQHILEEGKNYLRGKL